MALVDEDETAAYCIHSLEYVAQESLHEVPVPGDDESADRGDNLGNAEGQPADNERPLAEDNKLVGLDRDRWLMLEECGEDR